MEATTTLVSPIELEKLISSIAHYEPPVCIRYRTLGHLWYPNFLRVVKIQGEKSVLFHDEFRLKLISLPDLSRIVQFELDSRFRHFEPNCHYQIAHENCMYHDY